MAAWLMMKRGAAVELLHMDQRPFVGKSYYNRAVSVARKLRSYVPLKEYYLTVAPMGTIMRCIAERVREAPFSVAHVPRRSAHEHGDR